MPQNISISQHRPRNPSRLHKWTVLSLSDPSLLCFVLVPRSQPETKDTLSWYLPEALAQAAVSALSEAFPVSREAGVFDTKFKQTLFREFVALSSGFGGVRKLKSTEPPPSAAVQALSKRPLSHRAQLPALASSGPASPEAAKRRPEASTHGTSGNGGSASHANNSGGGGSPRLPLASLLALPPDSARQAFESSRAVTAPVSSRSARHPLDLSYSNGDRPHSCVAGRLEPLRREKRDMAACSPLTARWLLLRQRASNDVRGGSSAREPQRMHCTSIANRASLREETLIASGRPTLRDVRRDAARRTARLASEYGQMAAEMAQEATSARITTQMQLAALEVRKRPLEVSQALFSGSASVDWTRLD